MTENLMKFVHRFRLGIYILMFLMVILAEVHHYVHAEEPQTESSQGFWPPDMVPHPHPPQPQPKDDDLA